MKSIHAFTGAAMLSFGLLAAGLSPATAQEAAAAQDTAAEANGETTPTAEKTINVTAQKITDQNHPDYVRCRTERVIGSLAKRRKTCLSNREWKRLATEGNRRSAELVETNRAGSTSGN